MLSIIFSTKEPRPEFVRHIKKTIGLRDGDYEIFMVINNADKDSPYFNGGQSLTSLYNEYLDKCKYDNIILCHDDIIFNTNNWGRKILKHFDRNPEYGIIGKAGSKYLPASGKWWSHSASDAIGQVYHESKGKKWLSEFSKSTGNKLEEVIVLDGLFMAVNRLNLKNRFDESFDGFHFYDISFTFSNFLKGVKIGVLSDISITHLSTGETNSEWDKNRLLFIEKYKDDLPKLIPYNFNYKRDKIKSDEPLVSIIIPIYNYGNGLNRAILSVLGQTYKNIEIIIIDDGSTNDYVKLKLDTFTDLDVIKVIKLNENSGPSKARNEGIKASKGEYILPLDADDIIHKDYVKSCVGILKNNPDISPVYCDTMHVGEIRGLERRPEWSRERLIKGPFIVNCSMFHREAFNSVCGYDEDLIGWEDYDLWLRMMLKGYIGKRIPKALFTYFHHESDGTVSTKANENKRELHNYILNKNKIKI